MEDEEKNDLFEKINLQKFLEAFTEKTMVQAKGSSKKKVMDFIPKFWTTCKEANLDILTALKTIFKSIKPKIVENSLIFLSELVKEGFIMDLEMLTDFWELIEKSTQSRTKAIASNALLIYKEYFYYYPDEVKTHMEKLKKE